MINPTNGFTIGNLAAAAGINLETIRFYQRKGLMRAPNRPAGSVRRYGAPDLGRVRFIKSAQRLGFSLDEIAQLLELEDGTHCNEARGRAQQKLVEVRAKLADLQTMETVLADLVNRCHAARGNIRCPLIDTLHGANWRPPKTDAPSPVIGPCDRALGWNALR